MITFVNICLFISVFVLSWISLATLIDNYAGNFTYKIVSSIIVNNNSKTNIVSKVNKVDHQIIVSSYIISFITTSIFIEKFVLLTIDICYYLNNFIYLENKEIFLLIFVIYSMIMIFYCIANIICNKLKYPIATKAIKKYYYANNDNISPLRIFKLIYTFKSFISLMETISSKKSDYNTAYDIIKYAINSKKQREKINDFIIDTFKSYNEKNISNNIQKTEIQDITYRKETSEQNNNEAHN